MKDGDRGADLSLAQVAAHVNRVQEKRKFEVTRSHAIHRWTAPPCRPRRPEAARSRRRAGDALPGEDLHEDGTRPSCARLPDADAAGVGVADDRAAEGITGVFVPIRAEERSNDVFFIYDSRSPARLGRSGRSPAARPEGRGAEFRRPPPKHERIHGAGLHPLAASAATRRRRDRHDRLRRRSPTSIPRSSPGTSSRRSRPWRS